MISASRLPEIEQLFSTTYGQPLDDEACRIIAERTEGWAAGLQLVAASIAVSQPSEVAAFISALSGATGPIYDFLAEEVLTRLSPETQRVLMHASFVDRVEPEYVVPHLKPVAHPWSRSDHPRPRSIALSRSACSACAARPLQGGVCRRSSASSCEVHLEREVSDREHPRDALGDREGLPSRTTG